MRIKRIEPEIVFDDLCEDCEWKRKYEALRKFAIFMMAKSDMQSGDFSKEAFMLVQDQQGEWPDERVRALLETDDE